MDVTVTSDEGEGRAVVLSSVDVGLVTSTTRDVSSYFASWNAKQTHPRSLQVTLNQKTRQKWILTWIFGVIERCLS